MDGCDFYSAVKAYDSPAKKCTFTIPGGWSNSTNISFDSLSNGIMFTRFPRILVWPLNYNLPASRGDFYDKHMTNSTFDGIANPLLTLGHVSLNFTSKGLRGKERIKEAHTCSLTPCVNTFNLSVTNGISTMEVLDTDFGHLLMKSPPEYYNGPIDLEPHHSNSALDHWYSTVLDKGSITNPAQLSWLKCAWQKEFACKSSDEWRTSTYWVNTTAAVVMYNDLSDMPKESVGSIAVAATEPSGGAHVSQYSNSSGRESVFSVVKGPFHEYDTEAIERIANVSSFPDLMSNVAASLTVIYQRSSHLTVSGSEGHMQNYVEISWIWLVLPTIVVVLGNVFLIVVIVKTKTIKTQIWKNSALAMTYHGYNRELEKLVHLEQISAIESHAEKLKVKFKRSERSGHLDWI